MNTYMIVEAVGYIGSILVVISVLMTSLVKLRVVNSIGAFIFCVYALIIKSYPTALMNFSLVVINGYYLLCLSRKDKNYDFQEGTSEDTVLAYMLHYYREDIRQYFSGWKENMKEINAVYLVCSGGAPVGILLGKRKTAGILEIVLEYSAPAYRDCSVGKYLYEKLAGKGIHTLQFPGNPGKHEDYLQKMGYVQENGIYKKMLYSGNS